MRKVPSSEASKRQLTQDFLIQDVIVFENSIQKFLRVFIYDHYLERRSRSNKLDGSDRLQELCNQISVVLLGKSGSRAYCLELS